MGEEQLSKERYDASKLSRRVLRKILKEKRNLPNMYSGVIHAHDLPGMRSPLGSVSSIHGLLSSVSNKEACKQVAALQRPLCIMENN